MKLGAQLYTVRNFLKTPEDFDKTLAKIKEIGYNYVQVSGAFDYDAKWLDDALKRHNLTCPLTHTAPDKIIGATEKVISDHKTFGCKYVGLGGMSLEMREENDPAALFYDDFANAIKSLKAAGLKFMYHNHAFEFIRKNGEMIIDGICDRFSPDELGVTLDTYWVQAAGCDPVYWIEKLKGRLNCVHLKDMRANYKNESLMAPIYEGNLNFDAIIEACEMAGTE